MPNEGRAIGRLASYMLVPLMPALLLGVSKSGAGRWLPDAASLIYWIVEWLVFWGMAFVYTRALTSQLKTFPIARWIVLYAGGLASAITWTLLSPWYNQIYVGWFTAPEMLDALLNPRSRLKVAALVQTSIAGSAGAGLWTLTTMLFESVAPVSRSGPITTLEPSISASCSAPRIIQRTPDVHIEDILALEAEDHYVRIHLNRGAELIHYRFTDAVTDMGPDRGIRVHRSFWVAKHAIKEVSRGHRMEIVLTNGARIPVSSSYRSFLKPDALESS